MYIVGGVRRGIIVLLLVAGVIAGLVAYALLRGTWIMVAPQAGRYSLHLSWGRLAYASGLVAAVTGGEPSVREVRVAIQEGSGTLTLTGIPAGYICSPTCGSGSCSITGVDTIPLAGDTTVEQLVPLLLNLSALALRLDKPLTARLMPIPGKKAGDETDFDFPFFANSKVRNLDSAELKSPFDQNEVLQIQKR